jgi:lysophospholipase L1-like esterase
MGNSPPRGGIKGGVSRRGRLIFLIILLTFLPACGLLDNSDAWIYAETPLPDGQPVIVTVGDSIAAGYMDCRQVACTGIEFDWWQDAIPAQAAVLSRGIGSSTTADLLENWSRDTGGADVVIVLSGVNDVAYGESAQDIIANFETMTARAHHDGITLVISTIMPSDTTLPQRQIIVEEVNTFLLNHHDWLIMDLYEAMSDPANPGYLRRDEIAHEGSAHPNAAGYARMTAFVRDWWETHMNDILED